MGFNFSVKCIGNFIIDFYCPKLRLAVEIDGDSHGFDEAIQRDKFKEKYLSKLGMHLIRYDDNELKSNIQGTIDHLIDWIENPNHR